MTCGDMWLYAVVGAAAASIIFLLGLAIGSTYGKLE